MYVTTQKTFKTDPNSSIYVVRQETTTEIAGSFQETFGIGGSLVNLTRAQIHKLVLLLNAALNDSVRLKEDDE